jgi:HSP20 family protein
MNGFAPPGGAGLLKSGAAANIWFARGQSSTAPNTHPHPGVNAMNSLIARSGLFDDFFKDVAPGFYVRPLHGDSLPSPSQIKIDVKETPSAYAVVAEVPGVSKEDIHVTVEGSVVTLRAEIKQQDSQSQDEKVLRTERYYGAVKSKAKYENGVLTLTLPKKVALAGQRLAID